MVMATTWYMLAQQARMPALGLEMMHEKWCAFHAIRRHLHEEGNFLKHPCMWRNRAYHILSLGFILVRD